LPIEAQQRAFSRDLICREIPANGGHALAQFRTISPSQAGVERLDSEAAWIFTNVSAILIIPEPPC
jgi:hypothetical protein